MATGLAVVAGFAFASGLGVTVATGEGDGSAGAGAWVFEQQAIKRQLIDNKIATFMQFFSISGIKQSPLNIQIRSLSVPHNEA